MRSFKKALLSTLAVLLCFALLVAIAVYPYFAFDAFYYQDASVRQSLAGQFDLLISGASQGLCSIIPKTLDETLGCTSYNLCGALEPMKYRYLLLKQEVERNPVSTVILELSYDAMTRTRDDSGLELAIYQLGRLETASQRISYLFTEVSPKYYGSILSDTVERGMGVWKKLLRGKLEAPPKLESQGFYPYANFSPMPDKDTYQYHRSEGCILTEPTEENLYYLEQILTLCQRNNIKVILLAVPTSESFLWREDNLDVMRQWYQDTSAKWDCTFYDFNLLKSKLERYPEATAYADETHMSKTGAIAFSEDLAQVLSMAQKGENIDDLFYSTYEEAIHARFGG